MCGIFGAITPNGLNAENLLKVSNALLHRGPDDEGAVKLRLGQRTIDLLHRRLRIIDLSERAHQPMGSEDHSIWIVYNGEVYNFKEIRLELIKKGYKFKSDSDTEVVLRSYQAWGISCLQRFNGMFALAIYDYKARKIYLARDRAGKKPLYYAQYKEKFVFASELKAILQDYDFPREIDYRALNFYLSLGYIPFDFSIFKYARKIPPGHLMVYDFNNDKYALHRYWDLPLADNRKYTEEKLLEELEYLLEDSVRLRLVSDVPLGAFLSGGLDSSLIVAMMSRVSDNPVKTFSIGFQEKKYNELNYAKIVARHFNTTHTELTVKPDGFGILPELVKHLDEPFADSSMIPTYYVSKLTRGSVTVALSGDGGDELFGGYSSYLGTLQNYYIAKTLPLYMRKKISMLAELLPERFSAKKQLLRLGYDPFRAFVDRMTHGYFKDRYRKGIFSSAAMERLGDFYNEPECNLYDMLTLAKRDFLNSLESTHFFTYLPEDILAKVDRTSMKVSLEVRCPLLDYRIIEFAFQKVPGRYKVNGFVRKYLLKKLAKRILPKEFKLNRKCGFAIPIAEWFRGELSKSVIDILLSYDDSMFSKPNIRKLIDEHKRGIDHSARLFTLLVFKLWQDYTRL